MSSSVDVLNLATLPSDIVRAIVSMESDWEPNRAIRLISQEWNLRMHEYLLEIENNKRPIKLLTYCYSLDSHNFISREPIVKMRYNRADLKHLKRVGRMIVPRSIFENQLSQIIFNMPLMVSADGNDTPVVDTRIVNAIRNCSKIECLEIDIPPTEDFRRCLQKVTVDHLSMTLNPQSSRVRTFDKTAGSLILSFIRDLRVKHFITIASFINATDLREFILEAMMHLKSIKIFETMEFNRVETNTYFKRPREFWNEFARTLNKYGNFKVEFSVEDPAIPIIGAGIYVTAKDTDQNIMEH